MMKRFLLLAFAWLLLLPPSGLIVDHRLQDRVAFAKQLLSQCSPPAYQILTRKVAWIQYLPTPDAITLANEPSIISLNTFRYDPNFIGGLAHELRHVQQLQFPLVQFLVLVPSYRENMERDAMEFSGQVWNDCHLATMDVY